MFLFSFVWDRILRTKQNNMLLKYAFNMLFMSLAPDKKTLQRSDWIYVYSDPQPWIMDISPHSPWRVLSYSSWSNCYVSSVRHKLLFCVYLAQQYHNYRCHARYTTKWLYKGYNNNNNNKRILMDDVMLAALLYYPQLASR